VECRVFGDICTAKFREMSLIAPLNVAKFAAEKQWPRISAKYDEAMLWPTWHVSRSNNDAVTVLANGKHYKQHFLTSMQVSFIEDSRVWFEQLHARRLPHATDKTLKNPHVLRCRPCTTTSISPLYQPAFSQLAMSFMILTSQRLRLWISSRWRLNTDEIIKLSKGVLTGSESRQRLGINVLFGCYAKYLCIVVGIIIKMQHNIRLILRQFTRYNVRKSLSVVRIVQCHYKPPTYRRRLNNDYQ